MALTLPQVNLNGTSRESLMEKYNDAAFVVQKAIFVVQQNPPHGRDYQTMPEGSYDQARKEHDDRLRRLESVRQEIETICLSLVKE